MGEKGVAGSQIAQHSFEVRQRDIGCADRTVPHVAAEFGIAAVLAGVVLGCYAPRGQAYWPVPLSDLVRSVERQQHGRAGLVEEDQRVILTSEPAREEEPFCH